MIPIPPGFLIFDESDIMKLDGFPCVFTANPVVAPKAHFRPPDNALQQAGETASHSAPPGAFRAADYLRARSFSLRKRLQMVSNHPNDTFLPVTVVQKIVSATGV